MNRLRKIIAAWLNTSKISRVGVRMIRSAKGGTKCNIWAALYYIKHKNLPILLGHELGGRMHLNSHDGSPLALIFHAFKCQVTFIHLSDSLLESFQETNNVLWHLSVYAAGLHSIIEAPSV